MGQESLYRSLDGRVSSVVGEATEEVEPALGHPARDVRLAQPALLDLPRATVQAGPIVNAARVGIGGTEPVLVGVFAALGLDERDERRVERRRVLPDLLEHDLSGLKDGGRRCVAQAVRRAIDVQDVGASVGLALREHNPIALDPLHAAEPDYIIYLPQGIAHGFQTLTDGAEVFYQMSAFYQPEAARGIRWDDPAFAVSWPEDARTLSARDLGYADFAL